MSPETEELLRDIYKALYLAAQMTVASIADADPEKARQVKDSQQHFNGLVERARAHLYTQLRSDAPSTLQDYKLESNTLENFKRIHHTLRGICKLILAQDDARGRINETDPDAPEADRPPA
jgi:Na+/phosphate symporter